MVASRVAPIFEAISAGEAIDAYTPRLASRRVVTSVSCGASVSTLAATASLLDHRCFGAGTQQPRRGQWRPIHPMKILKDLGLAGGGPGWAALVGSAVGDLRGGLRHTIIGRGWHRDRHRIRGASRFKNNQLVQRGRCRGCGRDRRHLRGWGEVRLLITCRSGSRSQLCCMGGRVCGRNYSKTQQGRPCCPQSECLQFRGGSRG